MEGNCESASPFAPNFSLNRTIFISHCRAFRSTAAAITFNFKLPRGDQEDQHREILKGIEKGIEMILF